MAKDLAFAKAVDTTLGTSAVFVNLGEAEALGVVGSGPQFFVFARLPSNESPFVRGPFTVESDAVSALTELVDAIGNVI